MSGHLYGSADNDRAMSAIDGWLTSGDHREEATEAELDAADAADRLAALEDAGCDVFPVGRMWVVYAADALLGSAPTLDAAVVAAFPAAVTRGLVTA